MKRPLVIDLCCGLGGWTRGFIAEGYDAIGFDIERHVYGEKQYPAQLVLQDILTLDGRQFREAAVIVASPPCQEFSYMAMPWKRAKQIARALRGQDEFPDGYTGSRTIEELTALFNACFRIAKEAGLPILVENVRGAEPWVRPAAWHHGSYFLWGDVPAIMPHVLRAQKFNPDGTSHGPGSWFAIADSKERGAQKTNGYSDPRRNGGKGSHLTSTTARKAASALIAEIPFDLAQSIARVFKPGEFTRKPEENQKRERREASA